MLGSGIRRSGLRSPAAGYATAVVVPLAVTAAVAWLRLPAFVFEHVIILVIVALAIPWGLRTAALGAIVSVSADNMMLREPIGHPAISGLRDAVDLALFAAIAVVVSGLVAKAREEQRRAEQAAERERRAREERDSLIATISHDLATPLTVLAGTLQLARRAGKGEVDLSRLFGRLETATARAASLVATLADARALDTDRLDLVWHAIDLRALVKPLAEMLDRFSERHPVVLVLPEAPVIVNGDPERLKRVIENLVSNAIKYSPDGGNVEMDLRVEGESAVLRVRDHGIGISPDARPHVFERAFRAPEAISTAPGLGLGLNIAAQIVAKHGGRLEIGPAEGVGTVVSLRVPLAAVRARGSLAAASPEHVRP